MYEVDTYGETTVPRNRERITLLVDRLEAGTDTQARGKLCKILDGDGNKGLCCLGVASEIAVENGLDIQVEQTVGYDNQDNEHDILAYGEFGEEDTLPPAVQGWFGFDRNNPLLDIPEDIRETHDLRSQEYAVALNDDHGLTLPEIGRCFRETYL